ncbi:MAG: hypothetical protein HFE25_03980 [Clostridia bacterium]|nr:hypothetical protein [Clostridia bacterium]
MFSTNVVPLRKNAVLLAEFILFRQPFAARTFIFFRREAQSIAQFVGVAAKRRFASRSDFYDNLFHEILFFWEKNFRERSALLFYTTFRRANCYFLSTRSAKYCAICGRYHKAPLCFMHDFYDNLFHEILFFWEKNFRKRSARTEKGDYKKSRPKAMPSGGKCSVTVTL